MIQGRFRNSVGRADSAIWNRRNVEMMGEYLYHLTAQPPSGEYAMNALLEPVAGRTSGAGIYARRPLAPRMAKRIPSDLPVRVCFGDNDWLHSARAERAVVDLGQSGLDVALTDLVPDAGHHLYLDNPLWLQGVFEAMRDMGRPPLSPTRHKRL